MRLSIILLLLIKESEEAVKSFEEDFFEQDKVSSCVNRIVKRHFDREHEVTILSQGGSKDYVRGMESTVRSIANTYKQDKICRFPQTKQVVVLLDGNFHRDLRILMSLGSFHPRARFLIVCTTIPADNGLSAKNYLIKVVQHLDKNKRLLVAIALESIVQDDLRLYGYTKTAAGNCENPEIVNYGNCSSDRNVDRLFSSEINYNQCPLRLATFDWPPFTTFVVETGRRKSVGIESGIVNLIVKRLNASTSFFEATPSQVRTIIGNQDADVGFGQMGLYDTNEYSYTKSYSSVQGLILLPKYSTDFQPTSSNLMPLEATVWIVLMIVIIFVIILRSLLPVFKIVSVLDILALFAGLGVTARPIRFSQRVYFISLVISGYILTQAYLANLTMIFTKAVDYDKIESLEELDKSSIPLGGSPSATRFFENKYPRISKDFKIMNLSWFKDNLVSLKRGKGGIGTYVEVSKYNNYDNWLHTTTVPEVITSYPIAIIVPNISTILPTCDLVITRIVEAGLLERWASHYSHHNLEADDLTLEADEAEGRMAIQQLMTIFKLLGIALSISTIVFIIELLVSLWRTKRRLQIE